LYFDNFQKHFLEEFNFSNIIREFFFRNPKRSRLLGDKEYLKLDTSCNVNYLVRFYFGSKANVICDFLRSTSFILRKHLKTMHHLPIHHRHSLSMNCVKVISIRACWSRAE